MKLNNMRTTFIFLIFVFFACTGFVHAKQDLPDDWELHEIEVDENGFLQKTAGDPYIVFPVTEEPICSLSGIQFVIRIDPMPKKPIYFELFWRPANEGFGENRKVFFIVPPAPEGNTISFTVPLEQQAGYSQVRLDFPKDLGAAFKIEKYEIVPLDDLPAETVFVDNYYKLSASETSEPAIIIPYILKTLRHGMSRMAGDPAFLIFWLLMIIGLLAVHRVLIRFLKQPDRDNTTL